MHPALALSRARGPGADRRSTYELRWLCRRADRAWLFCRWNLFLRSMDRGTRGIYLHGHGEASHSPFRRSRANHSKLEKDLDTSEPQKCRSARDINDTRRLGMSPEPISR